MHFVKHSLAVAMFAVLTGCGGGSSNNTVPVDSTPDTPDDVTTITSVSPQTAIIGQLTTFTLSGQKLSESLQVSLPNCQNISWVESPTTAAKFTCTPQAEGTQVLTVKTATGTTLFTGNITLQATAPAEDIMISSVEIPTNITVGEVTSFTLKGQNLSSTLQINLPQCQNITPLDITSVQSRFTCTPQLAGQQTLNIDDSLGNTLFTKIITIRNPPPTLSGSWQRTTANGCIGSIEGESIAGTQSKQPLFTFVQNSDPNSDTRLRLLDNEGISYLSNDCSVIVNSTDNTVKSASTTGIAKIAAIYEDISAVQQISGFNYYSLKTTYSNNNAATPAATAIVFKDDNTFCFFDGTVTPTNIAQFIQSVDTTKIGCFARSNNVPFSQTPPLVRLTTSSSILTARNDGELLLNVLERLNQKGQLGYQLLSEGKLLSPELNTNSKKTYDILTQITSLSDLKFNYIPKDEPSQTSDFEKNRLTQLNELGSQNLLFIGKKQLDAFFGAKTLYVKNNLSEQLTYLLRSDSDVNATKLISILDAQGLTGCRFVDIRLHATTANTYTTVCVNSSRNIGTFSYRYIDYPESTRTDALQSLLEEQQQEGFYPIRALNIAPDSTVKLLFERDSSIGQGIQDMQYKVYSQALPSNQLEVASLLNDQGKLGWHLWSQINNSDNQFLGTIFASLPFPHLPDGEPAVLDR